MKFQNFDYLMFGIILLKISKLLNTLAYPGYATFTTPRDSIELLQKHILRGL